MLVYAGVAPLGFFFTIWYAGAAHRNGDIILSINIAASSTGRGPTQDDSRHKHWSTPKVEILLPISSSKAAFAQAVGFRNVLWISCWVIRNSVPKEKNEDSVYVLHPTPDSLPIYFKPAGRHYNKMLTVT